MTVDKKLSYALISKYEAAYKKKYGKPVALNRHKEKWASEDLIESYGFDEVVSAMEYMFEVGQKTSWQYFVRNCGTILNYREEVKRDLEERSERRRQAKEWLS